MNEPSRQSIFFCYYALESDDAQSAYLFGLIRPKTVKRQYGAAVDGAGSRRQQTIECFVRVNSQELRVCKTAFVSIHAIIRGKLEHLQEQMKAGSPCDSVVKNDMRGRHATKPNRAPVADVDFVKAHIRAFHQYVSHYARNDDPRQEFLPPGLTISNFIHSTVCTVRTRRCNH